MWVEVLHILHTETFFTPYILSFCIHQHTVCYIQLHQHSENSSASSRRDPLVKGPLDKLSSGFMSQVIMLNLIHCKAHYRISIKMKLQPGRLAMSL